MPNTTMNRYVTSKRIQDIITLSKLQIYVVKPILEAVNDTLLNMEYNDNLIRKGSADIKRYLDSLTLEVKH
jgi:hypothetical protein